MLSNGNDNGNMVMPVSPMGNGNGGFGWGDGSLIWLLILFMFAFNGNGWGGYGGNGGYDGTVQRGFDQQSIMGGINGLNASIGNLAQSQCQGFAGVTAAVQNGFAQAEIAANARQVADLQQAFNAQTAVTNGLQGLSAQFAQCCCDNRLATESLRSTILSENCADRYEAQNNTRDLMTSGTANTQAILDAIRGVTDKLCDQELQAERRENENLRTQLNMANLAASQAAQTQQIENYIRPQINPCYTVPNPYACYQNMGCGCNA